MDFLSRLYFAEVTVPIGPTIVSGVCIYVIAQGVLQFMREYSESGSGSESCSDSGSESGCEGDCESDKEEHDDDIQPVSDGVSLIDMDAEPVGDWVNDDTEWPAPAVAPVLKSTFDVEPVTPKEGASAAPASPPAGTA